VKKVIKEHSLLQNLRRTFIEIDTLNKTVNTDKTIGFDSAKIYMEKCTNCSVALLCGHKSRNIDELRMPYYKGYYNDFISAELPYSKFLTDIENKVKTSKNKYYSSKNKKEYSEKKKKYSEIENSIEYLFNDISNMCSCQICGIVQEDKLFRNGYIHVTNKHLYYEVHFINKLDIKQRHKWIKFSERFPKPYPIIKFLSRLQQRSHSEIEYNYHKIFDEQIDSISEYYELDYICDNCNNIKVASFYKYKNEDVHFYY